jgi:predicted transcriptional regulator
MTTQPRISKAHIVEAMQALPEDAVIEDALERLRFMQAVEDGMRQLDEGQFVSQEEVERRLARWLK